MVGDTTVQPLPGLAGSADEGVLQTGREAVDIGTLIKIVQQAIELGTGTGDGGKTANDIVVHHAQLAAIGHRDIIVAAQVVIAQHKAIAA